MDEDDFDVSITRDAHRRMLVKAPPRGFMPYIVSSTMRTYDRYAKQAVPLRMQHGVL